MKKEFMLCIFAVDKYISVTFITKAIIWQYNLP